MKTFTHAITTVNMSQRLYYVFLLPHRSHIMLEAYLYLHTSWDLFFRLKLIKGAKMLGMNCLSISLSLLLTCLDGNLKRNL